MIRKQQDSGMDQSGRVPVVGSSSVALGQHPVGGASTCIVGGGGQAPGSGGTDRRYDHCYQVKDAGLGPYKQGRDAEYYWYRDADKDGWVCE
jgi:hypothetical protein